MNSSQHKSKDSKTQLVLLKSWNVVFSIGKNKASRPDGFTTEFFKESWQTIGQDLTAVVMDFFEQGRLLKEVGNTIIALVPKTAVPASQND